MEHRCSDRHPTDIKILIYRYGVPVAIGRIKNGSRYGLYIESDLSDVHVLQQLDVEILVYRSQKKLQRYKFESIVVHTNSRGFGVEIDAVNEEACSQLMEMIQAQPRTPKAAELFAMVANA